MTATYIKNAMLDAVLIEIVRMKFYIHDVIKNQDNIGADVYYDALPQSIL